MPILKFKAPSGNRSITYEECPGSPRESCQNFQFHSSRTFILDWKDRWSFCAGMLGFPTLKDTLSTPNGNPGSWISRTIPQGYVPLDLDPTGENWLYATSIEGMVGKGIIISYDDSNVAQYKKVEITVGYDALLYKIYSDEYIFGAAASLDALLDFDDDRDLPPWLVGWHPHVVNPGGGVNEGSLIRYVTKLRQPTAEYLTLPFGALKFVEPRDANGNLTPCPGSVGKVVAAQEIMYTWHQVPTVPLAVDSWMGSVNAFPFDGYPRGTLLLTTVDLKPYRWFFNQRVYDITYKMKYFQPKAGIDLGLTASSRRAWSVNHNNVSGAPLNEPFGLNHYLRYKAGSELKPDFQMLSSDGSGPPIPILGQPPAYPDFGATVYPYADFNNLFLPTPSPQPPE